MSNFYNDTTLLCYSSTDNCQNFFCFPENYTLVAKIIDVYDGDTVICSIISPLTGQISKISIRLNQIDTPEIYKGTPEEHEAALIVRAVVAECAGVENAYEKRKDRSAIQEALGATTDHLVILKARSSIEQNKGCTTFDAFGRLIADIYPLYPNQFKTQLKEPISSQPNESLSEFLTRLKLARPYECKQRREPWTKDQLDNILKSI